MIIADILTLNDVNISKTKWENYINIYKIDLAMFSNTLYVV